MVEQDTILRDNYYT